MNKIPTVFQRREDDRARVSDTVTPGCEWVLAGEGVATRKYDGTCVLLDAGDRWWSRREVKPGKTPPLSWYEVETDPVTGKRVGWEPIENSPFYKFFQEALSESPALTLGTYELIGPKINGNPEKADVHELIPHATAEILGEFRVADTRERDFETIRGTVRLYEAHGFEGIVWHHPDGRLAKIKVRDFSDT